MNVSFYAVGTIADEDLRFAVIASRYQGRWIYCRHRERDTWEMPGGRREPDESIDETARRELYEETGALRFAVRPLAVYGVHRESEPVSYGMLYLAEVKELGDLPESEIAVIRCFEIPPQPQTYPLIQPVLFAYIEESAAV